MTKDQERKVAAKQLLCARYTNFFCLPAGRFWALSKTEKRKSRL